MANKKYNDEDGVWRTIGGRRVFIKKGQSVSDAMKESGKFKSNQKAKDSIRKIGDTDINQLQKLAQRVRDKNANKEENESISNKYEVYEDEKGYRGKGKELLKFIEAEEKDSGVEVSQKIKDQLKANADRDLVFDNENEKLTIVGMNDSDKKQLKALEESIKKDQETGNTANRMKAIDDQQRYDRLYNRYEEQGYSEKEIKDRLGERPKTGLEDIGEEKKSSNDKFLEKAKTETKKDPYDDPESEESQRLQDIQSRYDDYLQKTEGRGASYGELAYVEGLRGKELDDFEKELDDFESKPSKKEKSTNEGEHFDVRKYEVEVQHDKGKSKFNVTASDEETAKKMVMNSEHAPESAIIGVKDKGSILHKEEKSTNEQFEVGDLKKKAQAILPKEDIDSHEGDLYIKKTKESEALLNNMKNKDSGMLSTFKDQQTGETWYDIPFANMEDDYKAKQQELTKTANDIMNKNIREKASKKSTFKEDLPKATEIKTQGTSNRKEVSENIQAHILDYYDSPEDFMSQMEYMHEPTMWHAGQRIAEGGSYLIYNDDMAEFLDSLKINPKGKKFDSDKSFQMYTSLVGRESEKLYNRLKKNAYNKYKAEHPLTKMTFEEFKEQSKKY